MSGLRLRFLGPMLLVAICFLLLCAFTAVSLFSQQAAIAQVFQDNIQIGQATVELEECLTDLIALEKDHVEKVNVLHDRVGILLANLGRLVKLPNEEPLFQQLNAKFAAYLAHWNAIPPPDDPRHHTARQAATRFLEEEVFKSSQQLQLSSARRFENSAEQHERVLSQLAWGLAVIGGLGAAAGVALGFGVARGLARSIGQLRVRLQNVAGKLDADLPEIVLTGEGAFGSLHAELDQLSSRIEAIVQTLQQREHEVLRAEQLAAVGQLAAGVGHELRNPLTSIKLLVQTGLEEPGDGLSTEDLQIIESEIRRMERSLQRFLDFTRPTQLERRTTNLTQLIGGVLSLLKGRAEQQRVALQVDLPEDALMVTADAEQIRQVLVNLGLNALDAMPQGGTLAVSAKLDDAGQVQIEVTDTGPGFLPAIFNRLFEPFVSGKDTGLGLGLVISKRIVEDHGGLLQANNRPQGGACLKITLPLADDALNDQVSHAHTASR